MFGDGHVIFSPKGVQSAGVNSTAVEEMDLDAVRVLVKKLVDRRLLSPLTPDERVLWDRAVLREQLLLRMEPDPAATESGT